MPGNFEMMGVFSINRVVKGGSVVKSNVLVATILVFFSTVLIGCSSSSDVEVPRNNMRKQLALQRHLKKLNDQNEKLAKTINQSSVINLETANTLDNSTVNPQNSKKISDLLEEYKRINIKTQNALDSFERSIKDDTQKNNEIDRLLDGFAVQCDQQQNQLNKIEDRISTNPVPIRKGDHVHIGISSQYVQGSGNIESTDLNSNENYDYNGMSGTAYFTYIGDYNKSFGIKITALSGDLKPRDEAENGNYFKSFSRIGLLTFGFRIPYFEMFNVAPEFALGVGDNTLTFCDSDSCDSDNYYKSNIQVLGFEIPFFLQSESAFSLGFKLSIYRILSDSADYYVEGKSEDSFDLETDVTIAGAGVMIGFAW